jgi:hypothetical protein
MLPGDLSPTGVDFARQAAIQGWKLCLSGWKASSARRLAYMSLQCSSLDNCGFGGFDEGQIGVNVVIVTALCSTADVPHDDERHES